MNTKSKIFIAEDDVDLEEQVCLWLITNPDVRVLGKSPVEYIRAQSPACAAAVVDYEVMVH
jgi:hypothetical protein